MANSRSLRQWHGPTYPQLSNCLPHYLSCCRLLHDLLGLRQLKDLRHLQIVSAAWVSLGTSQLQTDHFQRPFANDNSVSSFFSFPVLDAVATIYPRYWKAHGRKITSSTEWLFEKPKECHHYVQSYWDANCAWEPVKFIRRRSNCADGRNPV
jgi:hypothetical protein